MTCYVYWAVLHVFTRCRSVRSEHSFLLDSFTVFHLVPTWNSRWHSSSSAVRRSATSIPSFNILFTQWTRWLPSCIGRPCSRGATHDVLHLSLEPALPMPLLPFHLWMESSIVYHSTSSPDRSVSSVDWFPNVRIRGSGRPDQGVSRPHKIWSWGQK